MGGPLSVVKGLMHVSTSQVRFLLLLSSDNFVGYSHDEHSQSLEFWKFGLLNSSDVNQTKTDSD